MIVKILLIKQTAVSLIALLRRIIIFLRTLNFLSLSVTQDRYFNTLCITFKTLCDTLYYFLHFVKHYNTLSLTYIVSLSCSGTQNISQELTFKITDGASSLSADLGEQHFV